MTTRWEYRREVFEVAELAKPPFDERLRELGSEGWELVVAVPHEKHGYSHEVHFVFKRPT